MQGTRLSDGRIVVLKQIWTERTPTEQTITRVFWDEPNASDPGNHSNFVYDVLHSPIYKVAFFVMPYLMRVHATRFATVGEAMECFRQVFEVSCSLGPYCCGVALNVPRRVSPSSIEIMWRIGETAWFSHCAGFLTGQYGTQRHPHFQHHDGPRNTAIRSSASRLEGQELHRSRAQGQTTRPHKLSCQVLYHRLRALNAVLPWRATRRAHRSRRRQKRPRVQERSRRLRSVPRGRISPREHDPGGLYAGTSPRRLRMSFRTESQWKLSCRKAVL